MCNVIRCYTCHLVSFTLCIVLMIHCLAKSLFVTSVNVCNNFTSLRYCEVWNGYINCAQYPPKWQTVWFPHDCIHYISTAWDRLASICLWLLVRSQFFTRFWWDFGPSFATRSSSLKSNDPSLVLPHFHSRNAFSMRRSCTAVKPVGRL